MTEVEKMSAEWLKGYFYAKKKFERPRGEWVYKKFDEKTGISDSYFCSCCDFPLTGIYNSYCAVCGADMRPKKGDEKKSCLNCGSSECELGNRARYGFCGNWTMREGDAE